MSNNNDIANTMRALSQRPQTPPKHSLVLDKGTKRLKAVPSDSPSAKNQLAITPEDLQVSLTT